MPSNYKYLFLFLVLILYVTIFNLVFLLLVLTFGSSLFLNIVELPLFYFGLCVIAFLAMRVDKISILLFSRKNLIYSIPVLAPLIIGEIVIFALGGEHKSVDIAAIMLLPLVAFSEEYMFRGYFQNAIQKNYKWYVSLILTNIMFALLHVPSEIVNGKPFGEIITFLTSRFFWGSFSSLMYLISDNLLIPILVHGFYNLALFYFPTIQTMSISTIKIAFFFFIWLVPFLITLSLYRNRLRMFIPLALIIICLLASPFPFVYGQPQGYVLIYSPPRGYQIDWMDVKAFYMKDEGDRLYFYVEYYGAIPSSRDYTRRIYIYMDTDRNPQTGSFCRGLGEDYHIYFELYGDNSFSWADLCKWNNIFIKDLKPNARLAPGLNYMEIWVDKRDIGYTQNGIDFYIASDSYVTAIPGAELTYVVGSSVKQITVDGEPGDWGSISPSVIFPPRSINPPELEASSVYVANDDENLYFRLDTRGKPSTAVSEGELYRGFFVYLDTDNNDNTGYSRYGGAELCIMSDFSASPSRETWVSYGTYNWTGSDWRWQPARAIEGPKGSDFDNVFEFKIPLSLFRLSSGQTVGICIRGLYWGFHRLIPESGHLIYPITEGRNVDRSFFEEVLRRLNIGLSDFALDALEAWKRYENTRAFWNPLATTKKMGGSWGFNEAGVQNYPDRNTGIEATAETLELQYYDAIREMLRVESFDREQIEKALNKWSGNGEYVLNLLNEWKTLWNNWYEKVKDRLRHLLEIENSYRYPDYLLDPHHLGTVAAIWLKVSSWGEYTRRVYDQLYWSGVMFDRLSQRSLMKTRDFLKKGNIANAEKYLQKYFRHVKLRDDMFTGAADLLDKNLDVVQSLLIAEVSMDLTTLGLSTIIGPEASIAVDWAANLIWAGVEYSFDVITMEQKEAMGEALTKIAIHGITKITLNEILTTKFNFLDTKTIPEWIQNREGKYLFPVLCRLFKSEEWQFKLSRIIKGATVEVGVKLTESMIDLLIDLIQKEIEDMLSFQEAELKSPGELRVYDSKGRVTGLLNNKTREEIPRSIYYNGTVMLFNTSDSFVYEVVGIEVGNYRLTVTLIDYKNVVTFNATNIPISAKSTHRYVIDWDKLFRGEKGVNVQVDSDGDETFDWSFDGGKEVTGNEFTPPLLVIIRPWLPIIIVIIVAISIIVVIGLTRRRRGQLPSLAHACFYSVLFL
jgi:membrane protease YdiL (CAAX protease family)